MPTENKSVEPSFDLNTSEGGRGFVANLFVTVLRRHDFTTYIKERLAADFACTLSKFIACAQAREAELQQRLNAADQRIDELTAKPSDAERERLRAIIENYPNGDPIEYNAAVRAITQTSQ